MPLCVCVCVCACVCVCVSHRTAGAHSPSVALYSGARWTRLQSAFADSSLMTLVGREQKTEFLHFDDSGSIQLMKRDSLHESTDH